MGSTNDEARNVEGGNAKPVHITNTFLPSSGPGGTQPVSIADGADVSQGAKADAAATTDTGTFSLIALIKRLLTKFGTGTSSVTVQGAGANGAAVTGNPNLTAGSDGTNARTHRVTPTGVARTAALGTNTVADGLSSYRQPRGDDSEGLAGVSVSLSNNSTFDPMRANYEATVLSSAARTTNTDSADQTNYNSRGIVVVIDVTSITDSPSIVATIQGKSSLGSDYYTILASAAITGTGQTVLRVAPELTATANARAEDLLPRVWRVSVAHGDADSITYSISANYVL